MKNASLPNGDVNVSMSVGVWLAVAYTLFDPPSRAVVMVDEATLEPCLCNW